MTSHGPQHESVEDEPTAPTDAGPAPVALIADRYRVVEGIASGGMGRVVLATHVDLGRPVAIKVMQPPENTDKKIDFEHRFRAEARILANLDHPNLVTVHDFGVLPDGRCFLAMAYIEGPRLTDLVKQGPMAPERVIRIAAQIARALRYVHSHDIVHRDLSPSNVLLTTGPDGEECVKLVDFGIAQDAESDGKADDGLVLGSPHVMSPEQIDGGQVDARADVYGLGALMFKMLTGQWPFRARNTMSVLMGHLDKPVPTFAEVRADLAVPDGLEVVVQRCLAKKADDRYSSAEAVLTALQSIMELPDTGWNTQSMRTDDLVTLANTAKARVREQQAEAQRSRIGPGMLAVVGLLLAVVAGAAVYLVQLVSAPVLPPEPIPATTQAGAVHDAPVASPAEAVPAPNNEPPEEATPKAEATPEDAPPAPAPAEAAEAPKSPRKAAPKRKATPKTTPTKPKTRAKPTTSAPSGYQGVPDDF